MTSKSSLAIEEIPLGDSRLKEFVRFPFKLYKGNPYWVPDMISEEIDLLDPKKNPAFEYCDVKIWLAYQEGRVAGRIAAIINHLEPGLSTEKAGRISRLEFIDDREVVKALLETAENWLREKGMVKVRGPLGFSNLDHQGMLVEGFDRLPSIVSSYHLPYFTCYLLPYFSPYFYM